MRRLKRWFPMRLRGIIPAMWKMDWPTFYLSRKHHCFLYTFSWAELQQPFHAPLLVHPFVSFLGLAGHLRFLHEAIVQTEIPKNFNPLHCPDIPGLEVRVGSWICWDFGTYNVVGRLIDRSIDRFLFPFRRDLWDVFETNLHGDGKPCSDRESQLSTDCT